MISTSARNVTSSQLSLLHGKKRKINKEKNLEKSDKHEKSDRQFSHSLCKKLSDIWQ